MLLTVGIVKELWYISYITRKEIFCDLHIFDKEKNDEFKISLKVSFDSILQVFYKSDLIWKERIEDTSIGFSVESCHTISKIIEEIENGNKLYHLKFPSPL